MKRIVVAVVVVALLVAAGAFAALGMSKSSELTDVRARTTEVRTAETAARTTEGAARDAEGAARDAERASKDEAGSADTERVAAEAAISTADFQLGRQTACIASVQSAKKELDRIFKLQQTNFGRLTSDSKLTGSWTEEYRLVNAALTAMKNVYSAVRAGNYSSANAWVDRAIALIDKADAQVTIYNREVARINKTTDTINTTLDAFQDRLDGTVATCGFDIGS